MWKDGAILRDESKGAVLRNRRFRAGDRLVFRGISALPKLSVQTPRRLLQRLQSCGGHAARSCGSAYG